MNDLIRQKMLQKIRSNISSLGHHVYFIGGGSQIPQFAYSIGLSEATGHEIILAGASIYSVDESKEIIDAVAQALVNSAEVTQINTGIGVFTLRECHGSWTSDLLIGALDYYHNQNIGALQIVPDIDHMTIDVPNMSKPWSQEQVPWKWLKQPWPYKIPISSVAVTNLGALQGEKITEVVRWEEEQWELFSRNGPDVNPDDVRIIPISTLLVDPSLERVLEMNINDALWRATDEWDWHKWNRSGDLN